METNQCSPQTSSAAGGSSVTSSSAKPALLQVSILVRYLESQIKKLKQISIGLQVQGNLDFYDSLLAVFQQECESYEKQTILERQMPRQGNASDLITIRRVVDLDSLISSFQSFCRNLIASDTAILAHAKQNRDQVRDCGNLDRMGKRHKRKPERALKRPTMVTSDPSSQGQSQTDRPVSDLTMLSRSVPNSPHTLPPISLTTEDSLFVYKLKAVEEVFNYRDPQKLQKNLVGLMQRVDNEQDALKILQNPDEELKHIVDVFLRELQFLLQGTQWPLLGLKTLHAYFQYFANRMADKSPKSSKQTKKAGSPDQSKLRMNFIQYVNTILSQDQALSFNLYQLLEAQADISDRMEPYLGCLGECEDRAIVSMAGELFELFPGVRNAIRQITLGVHHDQWRLHPECHFSFSHYFPCSSEQAQQAVLKFDPISALQLVDPPTPIAQAVVSKSVSEVHVLGSTALPNHGQEQSKICMPVVKATRSLSMLQAVGAVPGEWMKTYVVACPEPSPRAIFDHLGALYNQESWVDLIKMLTKLYLDQKVPKSDPQSSLPRTRAASASVPLDIAANEENEDIKTRLIKQFREYLTNKGLAELIHLKQVILQFSAYMDVLYNQSSDDKKIQQLYTALQTPVDAMISAVKSRYDTVVRDSASIPNWFLPLLKELSSEQVNQEMCAYVLKQVGRPEKKQKVPVAQSSSCPSLDLISLHKYLDSAWNSLLASAGNMVTCTNLVPQLQLEELRCFLQSQEHYNQALGSSDSEAVMSAFNRYVATYKVLYLKLAEYWEQLAKKNSKKRTQYLNRAKKIRLTTSSDEKFLEFLKTIPLRERITQLVPSVQVDAAGTAKQTARSAVEGTSSHPEQEDVSTSSAQTLRVTLSIVSEHYPELRAIAGACLLDLESAAGMRCCFSRWDKRLFCFSLVNYYKLFKQRVLDDKKASDIQDIEQDTQISQLFIFHLKDVLLKNPQKLEQWHAWIAKHDGDLCKLGAIQITLADKTIDMSQYMKMLKTGVRDAHVESLHVPREITFDGSSIGMVTVAVLQLAGEEKKKKSSQEMQEVYMDVPDRDGSSSVQVTKVSIRESFEGWASSVPAMREQTFIIFFKNYLAWYAQCSKEETNCDTLFGDCCLSVIEPYYQQLDHLSCCIQDLLSQIKECNSQAFQGVTLKQCIQWFEPFISGLRSSYQEKLRSAASRLKAKNFDALRISQWQQNSKSRIRSLLERWLDEKLEEQSPSLWTRIWRKLFGPKPISNAVTGVQSEKAASSYTPSTSYIVGS